MLQAYIIMLLIMISKTIFLGISKKTKMNKESPCHFGKTKTAHDVVSHNHSLSGFPGFAILTLEVMLSQCFCTKGEPQALLAGFYVALLADVIICQPTAWLYTGSFRQHCITGIGQRHNGQSVLLDEICQKTFISQNSVSNKIFKLLKTF